MRNSWRALASALALYGLLSLSPSGCSGGEKDRGLYSDKESVLLDYLSKNGIPSGPGLGEGGPTEWPAHWVKEAKRAQDLFKKGSPRLRLAIARAHHAATPDLWALCGPEDFEAKHNMFGTVLLASDKKGKQKLREWLLTEAHSSYAGALLRDLSWRNLYDDKVSARQEKRFLPFLSQLYRQPGTLHGYPGREGKDKPRTIQEAVIELVPRTRGGRDLLYRWILADSKKVDKRTLLAVWQVWDEMCGYAKLFDNRFTESAVKTRGFAESWLLSPHKLSYCPSGRNFKKHRSMFMNNLWSQVSNPDKRVRLAALEYVLEQNSNESFHFIKGLAIPALMREKTSQEAQEVCARLKKERGKDDPRAAKAYDKALRNLLRALERPKTKPEEDEKAAPKKDAGGKRE